MQQHNFKMDDIENKHWEGIEKARGLTKEQFQKMLDIDEEMEEFMNDLDEWMRSSRKINTKYNFDPMLFLLWRISKNNGN